MAIYVTSSSALLLMTLMRQLSNSQYENCPENVQRVGMKGNLWVTPELCLLYLKTCYACYACYILSTGFVANVIVIVIFIIKLLISLSLDIFICEMDMKMTEIL